MRGISFKFSLAVLILALTACGGSPTGPDDQLDGCVTDTECGMDMQTLEATPSFSSVSLTPNINVAAAVTRTARPDSYVTPNGFTCGQVKSLIPLPYTGGTNWLNYYNTYCFTTTTTPITPPKSPIPTKPTMYCGYVKTGQRGPCPSQF